MRKRSFYYRNSKKLNFSASEYVAVGLLMYSVKYIKNEKYTIIVGSIGLILFLGLIINSCLKVYKNYKKKKLYLHSKIRDIDNMSGTDFEELLKVHFEKQGYKVRLTPTSNDYGADLVLTKGNYKMVVQAKRYKEKVGNKAVQEIIGAIGYYKASCGMVVTNSYFTPNAEKLATANNIILWNRERLIREFEIK